jgi:hypothetical protein
MPPKGERETPPILVMTRPLRGIPALKWKWEMEFRRAFSGLGAPAV